MKSIYILMFSFGLTACAGNTALHNQPITLANPASVYCIKQGGHLDIRDTPTGQVGYCQFKDGTEIEEWTFFRESRQN